MSHHFHHTKYCQATNSIVSRVKVSYILAARHVRTPHGTMTTAMDLVIVADATPSMGVIQRSILQYTLPHLFRLATLTGAFRHFALLSYSDYTNVRKNPVVEWSGWFRCPEEADAFAKFLERDVSLYSGGDEPEAAKSALHELLNHVHADARTVVLWFGDAAPHHPANDDGHPNYGREVAALGKDFDWISLCRRAATAQLKVYPMLNEKDRAVTSFFQLLAVTTGGAGLVLPEALITPEDISKQTIFLLLTLCGTPSAMDCSLLAYKKAMPFDLSKKHENNLFGYLPCKNGGKKVTVVLPEQVILQPVTLDSVKALSNFDILALKRRFRADDAFASAVFHTFQSLMQPSLIMSLTYNPIFGALWREICRRHSDSRRDKIHSMFSQTLQALPDAESAAVRQWVEKSYNALEEIKEAVGMIPVEERLPAVILDIRVKWKPKELLEIYQSCSAPCLARLTSVLNHLRMVEQPFKGIRGLPLALPDEQLFSMLPHLVSPGLVFTQRASVLLAMLVVRIKNPVLEHRAHAFLMSVRGRWLGKHQPQNYSYGFVRLVLPMRKYLTEEEVDLLVLVRDIQGLQMNQHTDISVKVASRLVGVQRPDHTKACPTCLKERSLTIFTTAGNCGPCAANMQVNEDNKPGESRMYECLSCSGLYAVVGEKKVTVHARCFYCRAKEAAPLVRCDSCLRDFVRPRKPPPEEPTYTCRACEVGHPSPSETITVPLQALLAASPLRTVILQHIGLDIPDTVDVFKGNSAFALINDHTHRATSCDAQTGPVHYNKQRILNIDLVLASIRQWVTQHKAETGMCMMCCEDMPKAQMVKSCGRKGCGTLSCAGCLATWYGDLTAGKLFTPVNMACPFCKRYPAPQVLARYNPQACQLLRIRTYDPEWHYGWCVRCYTPQPWVEKVCAQEAPEGDHFVCEGCGRLDGARKVAARTCPRCTVLAEKTHGCDHITCQCDAHWCWRCGKEFTYGTIYAHIYGCPGDDVYRSFADVPAEVDHHGYDDGDDDEYDY